MTTDSDSAERRRTVDHGPVRLSHAVAVLSALAAASAAGLYSGDARLLGAGGVLVLAGSLWAQRRGGVLVGALGLFAAVLVAGAADAPVSALLIGLAGVTVAWDAGENALGLGAQVGPASPSLRAQLVHLAGTLVVVGLTAGGGYWIYRAASGGQPVTALTLLLLAGALLVAALSE